MTQYRSLSRRQALKLALGSALVAGAGARPVWAASAQTSAQVSAASSAALADWPGPQPLHVIVPGAPGGLADNMMRYFLAERIGGALKTTIDVRNQPGAGGVTGMAALTQATPDGRTLAFADTAPLTLAPSLGKVPYDPAKDFIPVASVFALPLLVLATPALPQQNAGDFMALLALARQKPGALRWATGGATSLGHLMLEQIQAVAGVKLTHQPYPDGDQLMADALAGKFEVLAIPVEPVVFRQIRTGALRPLAVGAPARLQKQLPRTPTLAELNLPAANLSSVFGFFAPRGTPTDVVQKLNRNITIQSGDAEVRHHIDAEGLVATSGPATDFTQTIASLTTSIRAALGMAGGKVG